MKYAKIIGLRMKMSGVFFIMFAGSILSVLTFPVAYWLFGISPNSIMDWVITQEQDIEEEIDYVRNQ